MKLISARINNYKSYWDSGRIQLSPTFNVVVGQNDSGKTAFLEALSTRAVQNPHRSPEVVPDRDRPSTSSSRVEVDIAFEKEDWDRAHNGVTNSWFPVPQGHIQNGPDLNAMLAQLESLRTIKATVEGNSIAALEIPGHGTLQQSVAVNMASVIRENGRWLIPPNIAQTSTTLNNCFLYGLVEHLRNQIFAFRAERLNIGESAISHSQTLLPNASNLAAVIHQLQSTSPQKFRRLVRHVREVFPHIQDITCPPIENSRVRVLLWTVDPETERDDLAMLLADSGTGIGQVIAVLYVVVTSVTPKVIIVDEPQSFLHPGAVTKLIQILRQHPQHQFVISTHSPNAITAAISAQVFLTRRQGSCTELETVDFDAPGQARALLAEVGARLSDVFGADKILWVEGKTEENCFPLLMEHFFPASFLGVKVLGVLHTSDFDKSDIQRTVEIYRRLSGGGLLVPPALHFILDSEGLTAAQKQELSDRSGEPLSFLSRRMFENYLLDHAALAKLLSSLDGATATHSAADIETWISDNAWRKDFFDNREVPNERRTKEHWISAVHAGSLLHALFTTLTGQRVTYADRKVEFGLFLTSEILVSNAEHFGELQDLLRDVLQQEQAVVQRSGQNP